jgi:hypothetical protein
MAGGDTTPGIAGGVNNGAAHRVDRGPIRTGEPGQQGIDRVALQARTTIAQEIATRRGSIDPYR